MATSISQKNRYTFSALIFLVFFLLSLFLFGKRAIQPTIYTFRDLNSQTPYLPFLFSSPTLFEQQINSSIGQPISPISENKTIDSDFRDAIVNGELSVEDEKDPVLENDSFTEIVGNGADISESKSIDSDFRDGIINGELSVEDEKNPVLENDSFTEMVDNGGYISENKSIDSDFRGGIIKGELSVEDEKNPVLGKEFSTEMVDNGGDISFEEELKRLRKCDLYMGTWVKDEEYPFYKPGSCPYVDEGFSCQSNGRGDSGYLKWRWKPDGCDLPRFNATDFLVRLSGKRLMLVGDSMNRNQFESILCLLREGLSNKSRMYEVHGYKITKGRGYYIFKFEDYDCTVEFVRSHFLVKEGIRKNAQGNSNPTLSIDQIDKSARRWKRADIIIFNTGHWWTHGKTARGKNYYKEGDFIYPQFDAVEAYRRALRTWAKWINNNVNRKRQMVFYRGYSSAHFRGGDWDSGGTCNGETEPISGGAFLNSYPLKMKIVEEVIQEMQVPVILLNVTRLTNFRKDGHPSIYGKNVTAGKKVSTRRQDCSHWCLPGVPDAWNELIYATLALQ